MWTQFGIWLLVAFNYVVLVYFVLLNTAYLVTSVFSFRALRTYARRLHSLDVEDLLRSAGAPPVTMLVPAYNEEETCIESTRALLGMNYPEYDVIFINDGSTDRTLERMIATFDLVRAVRAQTAELATAPVRGIYRSRTYPNLWLIDKKNGGKSDALNAGLCYAQTPLFSAVDADSLVERDALMRLVRPFLEDGSTVAAGGIIRVANGCVVGENGVREIRLPRNLLARFQVVEYLRAFLAGRMGWDALGMLLIISGAFGVFRRSLVIEAGGFSVSTVGEDMELVVRLHRHCRERQIPYKITFVPDPVAWTEGPESLRVLGRQRDRWQRGLMQSLWRHRRMLLNPRYGRTGMVAHPYFFFLEGIGPAVELLGYVAFAIAVIFGLVSTPFVIAFLMLAFVFGVAISIASVALEEMVVPRYTKLSDFVQLFVLAVLENFGYRQVLTLWRVRGLLTPPRRAQRWGQMERKGFAYDPASLPPPSRPAVQGIAAPEPTTAEPGISAGVPGARA